MTETPVSDAPGGGDLAALLGNFGLDRFATLALSLKASRDQAIAESAALVRDGSSGSVIVRARGDGQLAEIVVPAGIDALSLVADLLTAANLALAAARSAAEAHVRARAESAPGMKNLFGEPDRAAGASPIAEPAAPDVGGES